MTRDLYVDSSVVLRALFGHSPAAIKWFDALRGGSRTLVASRLGELEVHRVARNAGVSHAAAADFTDRFAYRRLDDAIIDEARAIASPLKAADAIHLAAALRFGTDAVDIVTHDAQLARAALALGFTVLDPITDDAGHPPVA